MLGQHRQFTQAQDQQRIARALEDKADSQWIENVDTQHFLQVGAVLRVTVLEQRPVGERHVIGGDGHAIVKPRFGAQVEHHPTAVFAVFHRLGDQAVARRRFITGRRVLAGADHQWFVQLIDAVLQEIGCGNRAAALERVGVERIEGAECHDSQDTALGRLRVDPVEVGESGRVLERAELRIAMAFADGCAGGRAQGQADQEQEEGTYQV